MAKDTRDFLSNDFSHPNHRKAMAALIIIGILFGFALWKYINYIESTKVPETPTSSVAADLLSKKRELLAQPNPVVELSAKEIADRKRLLNAKNPASKMTAEQIRQKQAILSNI